MILTNRLSRQILHLSSLFTTVGMSFILSGCLLTEESTTALSSTMPPPASPSGPGTPDPAQPISDKVQITGVSLVLGDRDLVRTTFENVFLSSTSTAAVRTSFRTIYDATITPAAQEFGSPMSIYSTLGLKEDPAAQKAGNGQMTNENSAEIPMIANSTPARVAALNEACRQLMNINDNYLNEALLKIGVTSPSTTDITADSLTQLNSLFAPGSESSAEVIKLTLGAMATLKVNTPTITKTEQWRAAVFLACSNPYWQAL